MKELGVVRELVRYPVKSMAGTATESAVLGWHGLDGDRRLAFRRIGDDSGFPWISASRVPELLLYQPIGGDETTHVRTPSGETLEIRSPELLDAVAKRLGSGVELMRLKHGIFDDAPISVITVTTMSAVSDEAGVKLDRRRFRPNIVIETRDGDAFCEDAWVGGTLVFGDGDERPEVSVTARDLRCAMINLDPDTAIQDKRLMKAAVRLNSNYAGAYGTVIGTGTIRVGDSVRLV